MKKRTPAERQCVERLAAVCERVVERALDSISFGSLSSEVEHAIQDEVLSPRWLVGAMDRAIDIVTARQRMHPGSCRCDVCAERQEILEQLEKAAAEIRDEEGLP